MQKIKVANIAEKSGTGKAGPWTNWRVTDENGVTFSTFHRSAGTIQIGDTLEIDPTITSKGANFDEFKILESVGAPAPKTWASAPASPDATIISKMELVSRESIAAFSGIMGLAAVPGVELTDNSAKAYEAAISWAIRRLGIPGSALQSRPAATTAPQSAPSTVQGVTPLPPPVMPEQASGSGFPHIGALLQWCVSKGVDRRTFLNLTYTTEETLAKVDIESAYQVVADYLKNKPDPNEDIPF